MRTCLIPLLLLLSACSTPSIDLDYDPARTFSGYHDYAWATPKLRYQPDDARLTSDLTEQRITSAVQAQLPMQGLVATTDGQPDVRVQATLITETRQEQVTLNYGNGYGPYWGGFWGSPGITETRSVPYKVAILQIDLLDGRDGKLVWRGSAEQVLSQTALTPGEREAMINTAVAKILAHYPPQ